MREAAVAFLLFLAVPPWARAQDPQGGEFQVNAYTTDMQCAVGAARQPDGTFLIVWESTGQDGDQNGIYARRYGADGVPLGDEFLVNVQTSGNQQTPAAAALGNGGFVVVWDSVGQDGSASGLFGRRIDATGAPTGGEFAINTYTSGVQMYPRVAGSSNSFIVVWNSPGQDGSSDGIFGRCFNADTTPLGDQFLVNSVTTGYQFLQHPAMNASGHIVVAWMDYDRWHSYAQLYAPDCTRVGGEFQVAEGVEPTVGMAADGRFVVASTRAGADGDSYGIEAQRFDASGTPVGPVIPVNTLAAGVQELPRVSMAPNGDFVLAWDTYAAVHESSGISTREFRASGVPAGPELQVNPNTTGQGRRPALAGDAGGNFVVVWPAADGSSEGVMARRYLADDLIFMDGFNDGSMDAWSSASMDNGDLSVSGAAALASTPFGLQASVNDVTGLFAQDESPEDEGRYRARFYFDPNGFDPGLADNHLRTRIFIGFQEQPQRRLFAIVLRKQPSGQYSLLGRVRQDDNSQADTGFFDITDEPHYVEIDWQRSSGPDALDGRFQLWIDGSSVATLTDLDNSISGVDMVRLGAMNVKTSATGAMFFDEFESRRRNPIGAAH